MLFTGIITELVAEPIAVPPIPVIQDTTLIAIMAVIGTALPLVSAYVMARMVNANARRIKTEEYARQDLVAQRLIEAAERAERHAIENNRILLTASNQMVQTSMRNGEKLDILTVQGDGQMTALIQSELNITKVALKSMLNAIAKDKKARIKPDAGTLDEVKETTARIEELKRSLQGRAESAKLVANMPTNNNHG